MKKLEKEENTDGTGISASNCVSESGHAAATYDLQVCGTIDLKHFAARGQSESNNDFGQEIELLVHGRKAIKEKITRGMGRFHFLTPELHRIAVLTAKWNRNSHRYDFKIAMVEQLEMKCRKEEIILEKKLENALEDYIDDFYLFDKYNSKRCWREKVIALENDLVLKSESARLASVKVRSLGDY